MNVRWHTEATTNTHRSFKKQVWEGEWGRFVAGEKLLVKRYLGGGMLGGLKEKMDWSQLHIVKWPTNLGYLLTPSPRHSVAAWFECHNETLATGQLCWREKNLVAWEEQEETKDICSLWPAFFLSLVFSSSPSCRTLMFFSLSLPTWTLFNTWQSSHSFPLLWLDRKSGLFKEVMKGSSIHRNHQKLKTIPCKSLRVREKIEGWGKVEWKRRETERRRVGRENENRKWEVILNSRQEA